MHLAPVLALAVTVVAIPDFGGQIPLNADRLGPAADAVSDVQQYLLEFAPGETAWVSEQTKSELKAVGINFMDITEWQPLDPEYHQNRLVETAPGEAKWMSEAEKLDLRRAGIRFMDITEHQELDLHISNKKKVTFPSEIQFNDTVGPMLEDLEKDNMKDHLETFSAFHTRYYKSDYGRQSSEWLLKNVNETVAKSGALEHGATVKHFEHSWGQNSVIVTIPGASEKTVVVGAHQDSINLFIPSILAAPGADDDGSGTVTIWEALRVLLTDEDVVKGKAPNTIEFHWYSAEEGGLLGSQAIFQSYQREGREVKAMLQQDMTGYVRKTIDAGEPESVGVITDYVDEGLTDFIKKIIEAYCDIPMVETKCGYACSDHASASKAGYPSAFVIESEFDYSDPKIHSTQDKLELLSFDHMLQHAKMTLALAYELAFADFD